MFDKESISGLWLFAICLIVFFNPLSGLWLFANCFIVFLNSPMSTSWVFKMFKNYAIGVTLPDARQFKITGRSQRLL